MFGLPIHLVAHMTLMIAMIVFGIFGMIQARFRKTGWFKQHRLLMFWSVILGVSGVLVMAIFKMMNGYGHFQSEHSEHGLIAMIVMLLVFLCGNYFVMKFKFLKWPHRIAGYVALVLCLYAAYLGFSMILS
jgi:magnesium-transporting ATPase (P-type)